MRYKRYGSVALVAALGLTVAACGSSSSSSTKSTGGSGSASSAPSNDTVTAINDLTGVGTSVALDPSTVKALTGLGVQLSPWANATFDSSTATITFPITSGYVEIHTDKSLKPGYILGSIQHDGSGFTLSAGTKSLTLGNFVVDPGNSMLYGTVDNMPDVPLATLDGSDLQVSMSGQDVVLQGTKVLLTQTAAMAIDHTFGTTAVTAGLDLGTVHLVASGTATTYTDATTDITRLTGQGTSVALDANTVKALTGLGVKLGLVGSATMDSATSTVTFPITGGIAVIHSDKSYKPGYIAGSIIHQNSGISLTAGGKTVYLTNFVVDPGDSVLTATVGEYPGVGGAKSGVPILFLDGTNVKQSMAGGDVVLDGTVAELTQTAASALDSAFGTSALTAGIPLGTVHLVASGTITPG